MLNGMSFAIVCNTSSSAISLTLLLLLPFVQNHDFFRSWHHCNMLPQYYTDLNCLYGFLDDSFVSELALSQLFSA